VEVEAALAGLGGFASRAALLPTVTRHALYQALDEGRIVRLQRGIYGLGLPDGTDALAAAAVSLRAVVSHDSAAVLWDLEMVHQPSSRVTVPRNRSRATAKGVEVRRGDLTETEVRRDLPVTTVLRTVLDCARVLALDEAVVIADSALRKGLVTIEELRTAAGKWRGKGAKEVRAVAALADPLCGSVLESLLRVLLVEAGLVPEKRQYTIRGEDGSFVAIVDFVWVRVRLIVEADGFEFHSERSDYRKDRRKANAYCRLDWRLLRFSWEDVRFDPDYVVEAVRHELAKSVRGTRVLSASTQKAA
jgi:very-short-patch-repair endonuclease